MFYIAAIVGAIASFLLGCLWYTLLFGKTWQKEMGFSDEKLKSIFRPGRMVVALLSEWFYAACLTGILFNLPLPKPVAGLMAAVVIVFSGVKLAIFDGKNIKLIFINEGYRLLSVALLTASLMVFS